MISDEKLKPCPFCGGTDSDENPCQEAKVNLMPLFGPIGRYYRVECGCGGKGPSCGDYKIAITAWNTRSQK